MSRYVVFGIIIALLVVSFLPIVWVNASVVTLQPSEADTRISERFPTLNFGPDSEMPVMVAQVSGTDYIERCLVRFDLSSIPAGSTIHSATLTLFCKSVLPGAGAYDYTVYRATFDWDEATVTWNSVSGGSWSTANSATIAGVYLNQFSSWTVTGIVRDWITNAVANQGFIIVIQATSGPCGGTFTTKEYGSGSAEWAPELQVDYGPPPRPVINSEWTNSPPTIDGQMGTGEWSNLVISFTEQYDDSPTEIVPTYVYFMNDETNLYVLVDAVGDATSDIGDECLLVFDFNSDPTDGYTIVRILQTNNAPIEWDKSSSSFDAAIGYSGSPTHKVYEFSIPFSFLGGNPVDSFDFCSPFWKSGPAGGGSMPFNSNGGGDNVWPPELQTSEVWQDTIDVWGILNTEGRQYSPATPYNYVGGELFSANKLAVLSPYLTLLAAVGVATTITSALIAKAKRK